MAVLALLAGMPVLGARRPSAPAGVRWIFHADFAGGLNGWMSFPLAQDIGFDPTLYTVQEGGRTVLVRQIESLGSRRLQAGVIRPLQCLAGVRTRVDVEYALRVSGRVAAVEIVLAGANGRRYRAPLPRAPGAHRVRVTGTELGLPAVATAIEAVALIVRTEDPRAAGDDRLTISRFVLDAERRPEVEIVAPVLERSAGGPEIIARDVVRSGSSLHLRLGRAAGHVELADGAGKALMNASVPAATGGGASLTLGSNPAPGLWTAKVRSGAAATDFRFLVLGAVPPHPRILLTGVRLDHLRREAQYAGLREQIHRHAQKLAGEITYNAAAGANIAHIPAGTDLRPEFVGELNAYFKLLGAYANAIAYNALDYALNGHDAALDSARRALLTVARWQTWTPPRFASHGLHTYYEVGVFAQRVALGYDLVAPRLTREEKQAVAQALREQIIEPTVKEYFLSNRTPVAASNWMANSVGGAIAAAVAVEGDVPDWDSQEGVALAALIGPYEQMLQDLFPGDGSAAEPAGYENFAMQGVSWGMAALDALGIRPQGTTRALAGFWWPYYAMVHPGLVLDTGDFDGRLEKLAGFAWGAEHAGIPALRAFYDRSSTSLERSAATAATPAGQNLEPAAGPLDLVCCSRPAAGFPSPPASRVFADRGSAVLRSGWGRDATVISLRAGPWFNHEHHDQGSFQVAAFGETLIGEAGYSSYYNDPNYPTYFIQAPGHNTVLVDRDPFSQTDFNGRFWRAFGEYPHVTADLLADDFDYLATDLAPAYAGQVTAYTREFMFIKPDFLVVRDRLTSGRPHVYTWLLHAPAGAALSTAGNRAALQLPGGRATLVASGAARAWKSQAAPIPVTRFGDLDGGVIHPPRTLHLESPRGSAAGFLVGFLFTPGAAAEPATVLERVTSTTGEGIGRSGGRPGGVVFRVRAGPLAFQAFSTDGTVLAVRGAEETASVLAIDARLVTRRGAPVFRSSSPVAVVWQRSAGGTAVHVRGATAADIETSAETRPAEVLLDGVASAFAFQDGMVVVRGVPKGEHRVSIRY